MIQRFFTSLINFYKTLSIRQKLFSNSLFWSTDKFLLKFSSCSAQSASQASKKDYLKKAFDNLLNKKLILVPIILMMIFPLSLFGAHCPAGQTHIDVPNGGGVRCVNQGNPTPGQQATQPTPRTNSGSSWGVDWLGEKIFTFIGQVLMGLSSLVLIISGYLFDYIVQQSIQNMSEWIGGTQEGTLGKGILDAWKTLRDVANLAFIFVLVYTAFKAMFDLNPAGVGTTIRNIVIIAMVMNFSLFFCKVVIDASNIASIGFYNAITTSNSTTLTAAENGSMVARTVNFDDKSISGGYMRMLGMQTWFSADVFKSGMGAMNVLVVGIMSSVFMLILAVILLVAGLMFAARFIVLIFVMILSPLALIAYIIPNQKSQFDTWKNALIDQSFFAPMFFALTWVTFKIGSSLAANLTVSSGVPQQWTHLITTPQNALGLLLNYVIIIGMSVLALVQAKSMASKTLFFDKITSGIGTMAVGGAAWMGRKSLGQVAARANQSNWLRDKARSGSLLGKAGLWTTGKVASGSFDARSVPYANKIPGLGGALGVLGAAGGVGGAVTMIDKKAKEKAAYYKKYYAQSDAEKAQLKKIRDGAENDPAHRAEINKIRRDNLDTANQAVRSAEAEEQTYLQTHAAPELQAITDAKTNIDNIKQQKVQASAELNSAIQSGDKNRIKQATDINNTLNEDFKIAREDLAEKEKALSAKKKDFIRMDVNYRNINNKIKEAEDSYQTAETRFNQKGIADDELSMEIKGLSNDVINKRIKEAQGLSNSDIKKKIEGEADRVERSKPIRQGAVATTGAVVGGVVGAALGPLGAAAGSAGGVWLANRYGERLDNLINSIPTEGRGGAIATGVAGATTGALAGGVVLGPAGAIIGAGAGAIYGGFKGYYHSPENVATAKAIRENFRNKSKEEQIVEELKKLGVTSATPQGNAQQPPKQP